MPLHISYARREVSRSERAAQKSKLAADLGTQYSLSLINQSAQSWIFYVYQKLPAPVADVFSLAWFASPFKIRVGVQIRFTWEIEYNFVWSETGILVPGVDFFASGAKDCDPDGPNTTEFSLSPGPGLSVPVQGPPSGSLVIDDAADVPNSRFSVGIGMSGTGTYAVQAGTNLKHVFTPTPNYWVAAGVNERIGSVLNINTIITTKEVKFPAAVYDLTYILGGDNTWSIEPG